jgi:hypothetical protein
MFPASIHSWARPLRRPRPGTARPAHLSTSPTSAGARIAWLAASLVVTLPTGASAQGTGTMQVTARVLPGRPPWHALAEVASAVAAFSPAPGPGGARPRSGVVRAGVEVLREGERQSLVVTVQHPVN